jgi:hypothetical protein
VDAGRQPLTEAAARAIERMRWLETTAAPSRWTDVDAQRATDAAWRDVGAAAELPRFLAARAARVEAVLGGTPQRTAWHAHRLAWLLPVVALIAGLAADAAGPGQRIDLLAPPWLLVLAWNLGVVALLVLRPLRARGAFADPLRRIDALRVERWLHLAAAALACGMVAGLYLRGLVLDYRAGWQSTFLDPAQVHALLAVLLAPASALTGIGVPDAAAVAALRLQPDAAAVAPAAAWIHLFATSLVLWVVLPRAVLALVCHQRARRLAADVPLDLSAPYFRAFEREAPDAPAAWILPYAVDPPPLQPLLAALREATGRRLAARCAPAVAFGEETTAATPADAAPVHVLFAAAATPEPEHQGVLLQRLGARLAGVLVDETAFAARFADDPDRLAQRREAWRSLAASAGVDAHFLRLPSERGA